MVKIKNWKRVVDSKINDVNGIAYMNYTNIQKPSIVIIQRDKHWSNKKTLVEIKHKLKYFPTERKAILYANTYMRSHPSG